MNAQVFADVIDLSLPFTLLATSLSMETGLLLRMSIGGSLKKGKVTEKKNSLYKSTMI